MTAFTPIAYHARSLWQRRSTTLATVAGVALVSFVLATVLMLAAGVERTLAGSGEPDNVVALRRGATAEMQSLIAREAMAALTVDAAVARDARGPLASAESVVLVVLGHAGGAQASVTVRGVGERALDVHRRARIVAGRMLEPGRAELVLGRTLAGRFDGATLGGRLRLGKQLFTIVGLLGADGAAFESELWGAADELMPAFSRAAFSSLVARVEPATRAAFAARAAADPRLAVDISDEVGYYEQQSRGLSTYVRILGLFLAVVFACGALAGAMMTLWGQVAARRREIGVLRALGFSRLALLSGFVAEGLMLSLAGGVLGLGGASLMQWASFTIFNLGTLSAMVFHFRLGAAVALATLGFAAAIGILGALWPAAHAARRSIVDSLRA
jgi:putative ABC transport system permease protein